MILYISNMGKKFIGGADNLHEYILKSVVKRMYNHDFPYTGDYEIKSCSDDIWEDGVLATYIKANNPDAIWIESSCVPSMRVVFNVLKDIIDNKVYDAKKINIFMHSSILSMEDQQMECDISPSLYDFRDTGIYITLGNLGVVFHYASANLAYISKQLTGTGSYFPIIDLNTKNMNPLFLGGKEVPDRPRNNNVLFINGYYHPAAGNLALMEAIRKTKEGEFQWYLVGDIFEDKFKDSSGNTWDVHYADVLRRSDVHLEGRKSGAELMPYFMKCYFNLILSSCETYSFKALEGISYKCLNVTTTQNGYLPWTNQAAKFDAGNSIWEFADNLLATLRNPGNSPNMIHTAYTNLMYKQYERQFGVLDTAKCNEYIAWYFSKMCRNNLTAITETLPIIFENEYNRLPF